LHKLTRKKVAIKIINKQNILPRDYELLKSEIEILKVCQHPNIIKMYDVIENTNYIYIIMDYCGGGDLFKYFTDRKYRLDEKRVCEIIHKLATSLYYLHSYGIIHRDLKLENIMMLSTDEDSDIKLVDFGLSKVIGPNEFCNDPFGTIVNLMINLVLCCS
jgi:serine/threonine protein kinase